MGKEAKINFIISGYYGFGNIGDEAVLAGMLQQLRTIAPSSRCIVLSGDPARTAAEHGVEAIHRLDIKALWSALRQGTVFISGGGTLFQDVTSSRSLYYYLLMVVLARAFGLPVIVYGQGIGPFRSRWNRLLTLQILRLAGLVIVRDRGAYEQLLAWGFDGKRLCLGADPALTLRVQPHRSSKSLLRRALGHRFLPEKPVLLVSLRPWPYLDASLPAVAGALDQLSRRGWQVVFVPLQLAADYPVCQRCVELMVEEAFLWSMPLTVQETLDLLGEADYCLGMRLHALILAAVHRVPMLGLAYDPKVESFLKELGLLDGAFRLPVEAGKSLDRKELLSSLSRLEAERERLVRQIDQRVEEMVARMREANRSFKGLLALVGVYR
ncbi:MAG: polysaccharide pyruvyl transferase CsaB [Firmicutes bacterium]|nr:polysaccharide pyruvyl transferase CsaB [Bacillota bacterium]